MDNVKGLYLDQDVSRLVNVPTVNKSDVIRSSFCEDLLVLVLVSNQELGTSGPKEC